MLLSASGGYMLNSGYRFVTTVFFFVRDGVMPHFPWCLCLLSALFVPQDDPVKSEMAKLQGDWQITAGSLPDEFMRKTVLTFHDDKLTFVSEQARTELRFRLNPQRQPKEIDLNKGERRSVGIYDLQGDQLKLCYEVDGRAPRPQRFEVITGTEVLLVLKRKKSGG
jgi:uncharacterized protein (TIGR03067 family)